MTTDFRDNIGIQSHSVAQLRIKTAELEQELADARAALERERAEAAYIPDETFFGAAKEYARGLGSGHAHGGRRMRGPSGVSGHASDYGAEGPGFHAHSAEARTQFLVNRGRRGGYHPGFPRGRRVAVALAVAAVLVVILALMLAGGGASWPSSVATVQSEAARACQNPDVKSEPDQVNFACASATRQILWVFALITSDDNPRFGYATKGRMGLEPIAPTQGGDVAWSLNLHHPYNPANPIDSLAVAARAINNIIGGATLTGANGRPVVQPGLESVPANCRRYTGSAALTARQGFPAICAKAVTSTAGQAALVADVYKQWVVGAAPQDARDAALLFQNAQDPGAPKVQAILRRLPHPRPTA